jgi:hypothetical protein
MSGQVLDFNTALKQGEPQRHSVDAEDIRTRLHSDPASFVAWLYSGRAYTARNQARIGNAQGEHGSSLAIDLKTGLWKDHATDAGGDLISLYRAWAGYSGNADFVLSLKEIARDFLGDPVEIERSAWRPDPATRIAEQKAKLGAKPREENLQLGAPVAEYKYFDLHGNIIASVRRYEPDGTRASKTFRPWCFRDGKWVPGAPDLRPLYRLPEIATAAHVVLTEGEGKADALTALGIPATSAMQGAKAPLDKTDWSPLAGKTVTIWPDNDEPGFAYANAVAGKLKAIGCAALGVTPPQGVAPKWDAADCVSEGKDPHELIKAAVPIESAPQPKPRINLLDIDDIENLPPPSWLIGTVLTENGLSVLWGRSGAMKSFVALDMALCVATGADWHGHTVKHGMVVYVAAEGSHGLGRRAVGWRRTRGKDLAKPSFKLIPHAVALTSDDLDAMVQTILQLATRPSLIVIDTLARTFGQGDENKQADMNAYVGAADRLRESTGAHVMIIHHSGVHEDKRERGSNVLRGAADTVIKVARKDDKLDIINQGPEGKQKDAEEFPTVKLRTQKVYFEQADAEQSTLILNLREDDAAPSEEGEASAGQRLGRNEQSIIEQLKRLDAPAGFMRLAALTQMNKGSLTRALESLVEKNILEVGFDPTGNTKLWTVI